MDGARHRRIRMVTMDDARHRHIRTVTMDDARRFRGALRLNRAVSRARVGPSWGHPEGAVSHPIRARDTTRSAAGAGSITYYVNHVLTD